MDDSRFLDCLAADYAALRQAAEAAEPTAPVPACPGWTMADLVSHVGVTYLHKVVIMRTGEWPEDWPPPATAREPPVALLDRGYAELTAEFAARAPADPTPTWYEPDESVAFWIRRMAQETAIHRIDAQQAAAVPLTQVPDDLAVDGVDEVLNRMLAYGSVAWPEEFAEMNVEHLATEAARDTIAVTTGGTTWTVRPSPRGVTVTDGAPDHPRALIDAAPDPLLRWLWGRALQSAVQVTGDPAWAAYLREMIAAATV
jgi:uncharacterized protein (TIGR03083 family)